MSIYLIILAGGKGTRLGFGYSKGLVTINDKSLIVVNIENFNNIISPNEIVVVCPEDENEQFVNMINQYENISLCYGGERRQDSVINGINKLYENKNINDDDIIIIHNVANPFVNDIEIQNLINETKIHGASSLAQKSVDTLRHSDENLFFSDTISRTNVYKMQTPQAFRGNVLSKMIPYYKSEHVYTDDIEICKTVGIKSKIVECSSLNFKITTQEDYKIANQINTH